MKEVEEPVPQDDRHTLIALCCEAKIPELRKQLALPQFKQLLCSPLQFRDFQNETILHYMCAYTYEELAVVHELLDHGAVACVNMGPVPPLAYAAQRNHKEVVRLLLAHGAQPEPAMAYAVNPEILKLLKKKVHDNRKDPPTRTKDPTTERLQENHFNKVSLAISKHISTLFSYVELSEIQEVSDHLAKATSFSGIVTAYQTMYELCKPEGEKATGEFVVSALLLPWGLPSLARHVAIDRQGQANRIAEIMFKNFAAYQVAIFVESKLAIFEKDRPRSSFPHLYITLVHAIADAIITSLIGNNSQAAGDTMVRSTSKLLKWMSAVGFASVNSAPEPSSILKGRLQTKSLYLACRHLCTRADIVDMVPASILQGTSPSPPFPQTSILSTFASSPSSSPSSSPTISPSPSMTPIVSPSLVISEDSPSSSPLLASSSPQSTRSNSPHLDPAVIVSPPATSPPPDQGQTTSPATSTSQSSQSTNSSPSTSPSTSSPIASPAGVRITSYSAPRPVTPPQSRTSFFPRTTSPPHMSSPIVVNPPSVLPAISPYTSMPVAPITVTAPTVFLPVAPPLTLLHTAYPITVTAPIVVSPPQSALTPTTVTTPTTPATSYSQYLITVRLDYPNLGDISVKMYNTTALSVLHDKISARLRSRLGAQIEALGWADTLENSKKQTEFVFVNSVDGRQISMNEPGIIGDLEHPSNFIILRVVNR